MLSRFRSGPSRPACEAPASIATANLHKFQFSDEFICAAPKLLREVSSTLFKVRDENTGFQAELGELTETYQKVNTTASDILAGFLLRVSADVESLWPEYSDISNSHTAMYFSAQYMGHVSPGSHGSEHVDSVGGSPLGLRYIAANRDPTIINELLDFAAGEIARMPKGRTLHTHGYLPLPPNTARLLLSVDF